MTKFSDFVKTLKVAAPPAQVAESVAETDADAGFAPTEYKVLLEKYGVSKVDELSDEKFDEFHQELVASIAEASKAADAAEPAAEPKAE